MSRTYRKVHDLVKFCGLCNKPDWINLVDNYETCECENPKVFAKRTSYSFSKFSHNLRKKEGLIEIELQNPSYESSGFKAPDGINRFGVGESKKDWKKIRNRKYRSNSKQVLRNRNKKFQDMVFPKSKKCILWDMY